MSPPFQRLQRILIASRSAWSILGMVLVLIGLLELMFRVIFGIWDLGTSRPVPDPRVISEGYCGESWPRIHFEELGRLSDRWESYVYFRQRPFRGATITIDEEGLRATWRPPAEGETRGDPREPMRILMLGGSSLWGYGARDDRTIPSLIAQRLHARGLRFEIRNLAEIGYVNTQELIALVRELQRGYRPGVVIFYDGVNDTTSALLEGRPTLSTNEINRVREFNLLQSPARLSAALAERLIKQSATQRFARAAARRLGLGPATAHPDLGGAELELLAEGVVDGYRANLRIVQGLAAAFGFRPVFVWQPVVFSKRRPHPYEREEAERYAWTQPIFEAVHRRIQNSRELLEDASFLSLEDLLADSQALDFIDFCHTTERANEIVAEAITLRLLSMLPQAP